MIPIELTLENFTCHVRSVIDFTQFDGAVIVGKTANNMRRANQVGKSKIFAGLTYALFNEANFDKIDSIIRDDADKCHVSFVFMVEGNTYKVDRTRGRKANSADLRLFVKRGDSWDDITERTASGTEKALSKIIKINHLAFSNSIHFRQADLSGLATLTPAERKNLLRTTLQLTVYGQLEKLTKKRLGKIVENELVTKVKLGNYSELDKRYDTRMEDVNTIGKDISSCLVKIEEKKTGIELLRHDLETSRDEFANFKSSVEVFTGKLLTVSKEVVLLENKKTQLHDRITDMRKTILAKMNTNETMKATLVELETSNVISPFIVQAQFEEVTRKTLEEEATLKALRKQIQEWSIPLPGGPVCEHCRQPLTDQHRESCQQELDAKINEAKKQIDVMQLNIARLNHDGLTLSHQHSKIVSLVNKIDGLKKDIQYGLKEIQIEKTSFDEYAEQFKEAKLALELKKSELGEYEGQRDRYDTNRYNELKAVLTSKENSLKISEGALQAYNTSHANFLAEEKSYKKEIAALDEQKIVRDNLRKELDKINSDVAIHNKVAHAFGSKGIPSLIIHNILDDLQHYANDVIGQIKPGLQLQFEIDRENKKGEQTDTLDINYIYNGRPREYAALGGAQQFIVSLALRIGLSTVIQRIFGVEIKLLMLDEIDSSLDDESLDAFLDLIKVLQKETKIVLITHNKIVKDRFSHAIVVEQDTNGNSYAKLASSW